MVSTDDGLDYFLLEGTTGVLRLRKPLTEAKSRYVVRESLNEFTFKAVDRLITF